MTRPTSAFPDKCHETTFPENRSSTTRKIIPFPASFEVSDVANPDKVRGTPSKLLL